LTDPLSVIEQLTYLLFIKHPDELYIARAEQNGQFRTPQHIIKLMVDMTAPTPKDGIVSTAIHAFTKTNSGGNGEQGDLG
jgi:hypothetical protein